MVPIVAVNQAARLRKLRFKNLRLNDSWTISPITRGEMTFVGNEGESGWMQPALPRSFLMANETGWAHARFIPAAETLTFELSSNSSGKQDLICLQEGVKLQGLDPGFESALQSQIMTLQLGLVGLQTRQGEPLNYPLQWLRDGAFVIVGLARAGQTDLAEKLISALTQDDFFGGFGAEGDAPGLALWALV